MEALVTIVEVGAYSERQYQRQDGTAEYFKSRGFVLKRGGDVVYGELIGEAAGATTTIVMRMCCIFLIFSHFNLNTNYIYVLLSEEFQQSYSAR